VLVVIALQLAISIPPPLCRGRVVSAYDPRMDRTPSQRAVAEVQQAYDTLCPNKNCGSGHLFENATIGNNAVTWVSGLRDGASTKAKIVYSAPFLDGLDKSFGAGASFGVLAHEVGHHLTAALSMRQLFESSWNEELRADYLAGCALGRAGRSSHELENALRALSSYASPTHPSFEQRVPIVRRGYDECKRDAPAVEEKKKAFGLGALVDMPAKKGCRYPYRLGSDVVRVGPVVAKRRRSQAFASKETCEVERRRMTESGARVTEECICE
jgi:hypothetical protein